MHLDQIAADFDAIERLLESNGGEVTPDIEAQLEALGLAEAEKLDNYCFKIKALEGDCDYLKKAEDELAAKRKAKGKFREWLLLRAKQYMETRELQTLQGRIYRLKIVHNGGRAPVEILVPVEDLPRGWTIVDVRANKDEIRKYLDEFGESGLGQGLVRLGEVGTSLRIF